MFFVVKKRVTLQQNALGPRVVKYRINDENKFLFREIDNNTYKKLTSQ